MNLADLVEQYLDKGIHEIPGPRSHPQILAWIKRCEKLNPTDIPQNDDQYSWCGVLVGAMVLDGIAAGQRWQAPPPYYQGAKRWEKWSAGVLPREGQRGDVLVVRRKDGGHHVTIISKAADKGYYCTGGNQSNEVNAQFYPLNRIYSIRRP